jgi:hypothetical protein
MKTFKRGTFEQCLFFQDGNAGHLLVKVRGRGWFRDTRRAYTADSKPPSRAQVLTCLTTQLESAFEKVSITSYRIVRRKKP